MHKRVLLKHPGFNLNKLFHLFNLIIGRIQWMGRLTHTNHGTAVLMRVNLLHILYVAGPSYLYVCMFARYCSMIARVRVWKFKLRQFEPLSDVSFVVVGVLLGWSGLLYSLSLSTSVIRLRIVDGLYLICFGKFNTTHSPMFLTRLFVMRLNTNGDNKRWSRSDAHTV